MNPHPQPEELAGLMLGTLSRAQARFVVRHLLAGCASCQAAVASAATDLLGSLGHSAPTPVAAAGYDRAAERAIAAALMNGQQLKREKAKVSEALDRLAEDGVEGLRQFPLSLWGLGAYETLAERSRALRHENPTRMVALAQLATQAASRLSVERYGKRQVMDFECRASLELANAYRVANRLHEAQSALDRAATLFLTGTEDRRLRARFHQVQASIHGDRRQFGAAFKSLKAAHRIYTQAGEDQLAAQVLITEGGYRGYANDLHRAISCLRKGLASCDPAQDAQLARAARSSIALFLIVAGQIPGARSMLRQNQLAFEEAGKHEIMRLQWHEGLIDGALGEFDRAERRLVELRQGFLDAGTPYTAAILSIDLASVWMNQGKERRARGLALDAAQVFLDVGIERDSMLLVTPFRTTSKFRLATKALLAHVTQTLGGDREPPTPGESRT